MPKRPNQEKNCTQLNCLIVTGMFLKSVNMCSRLASSTFSSSLSSSMRAISSGEYSLVVITVIRMLVISTPAPMMKESIRLSGTFPGSAVLEMPIQLVST